MSLQPRGCEAQFGEGAILRYSSTPTLRPQGSEARSTRRTSAVFLPRERVDAFRTRSEILSRTDVRIGVFNDPVLVPRVKRTFPNAQIVLVPYYSELPDFSRIDAAVWTLAQAEAIAAAHPELAAVQPSDAGDPYLFAYLLPPDSEQLANFVNYWLQLKRTDGSEQRERDYWIKRLPRENASPRWSIRSSWSAASLARPKNRVAVKYL